MGIMDVMLKEGWQKRDGYEMDDFEEWAMDVLGWDEEDMAKDRKGDYLDVSVTMARTVWAAGWANGFDFAAQKYN